MRNKLDERGSEEEEEDYPGTGSGGCGYDHLNFLTIRQCRQECFLGEAWHCVAIFLLHGLLPLALP